MDFEDMTIIWGSQNEEPLYALNKKGLTKMLHEKRRAFNRKMRCQELQTYGGTLAVMVAIAFYLAGHYSGLFESSSRATSLTTLDIVALFVAAACWLHFALSIFTDKKKQQRRENAYTATLSDDLERDISQVDFQINLRRHIAMRYVPPYFAALLILMATLRIAGQSMWILLPISIVMVITLQLEARGQKKLVEREMLPRKQELESLRFKLTSETQ